MNSRLTKRWLIPMAGAAGLAGCLLGPWNMEVDPRVAPVTLQVSCMLVAGRPFDSLWLERPLAFNQIYDSSVAFVDTSATRLFVTRAEAPAETLFYHMAPTNTRVWKPDSTTQDTVRMASHYTFHAFVTWNAAREFPAATEIRHDTLTADAYVQSHYAVRRPFWAPLEALHPSLSMGLPAATVKRALGDTAGYLDSLYDSLSAIKSLAAVGVTPADFLQYLRGILIERPLRDGDSAYYVFDPSFVPDPNAAGGGTVPRYSRPWKFAQDFDPRDYGGLVLAIGWDTTRARIYSPLQKAFSQSFGRPPDSESLYQPGSVRVTGIAAKSTPGIAAYPDTMAISNLAIGYTGRNMFYFYAVDSDYASEHLRDAGSIPGLGGGGGGGGAGNTGASSASNVRGGGGYFAAAAVDSFAIHIMAVSPDTFSVQALRQVWLRHHDTIPGG